MSRNVDWNPLTETEVNVQESGTKFCSNKAMCVNDLFQCQAVSDYALRDSFSCRHKSYSV